MQQLSHQNHLLEGKEQSPVLPPLCTDHTPTTGGTSSILPWALPSQSPAESQMPSRNWELLVKVELKGKSVNLGLSLEAGAPHSTLTSWSPPAPPLKCPSTSFSILTQPHLDHSQCQQSRKAHAVCSALVQAHITAGTFPSSFPVPHEPTHHGSNRILLCPFQSQESNTMLG